MKLGRIAGVVLLAACVWAQENAPPMRNEGSPAKHRPRIGLVLEGGGALGFAHVGVIQWLEENRIPVDVIAGTSMGGLVGGIYATGESPAQIRELIRGIHWNAVLRGETPYKNLSFRRKEDRREYPNAFEFGIRGNHRERQSRGCALGVSQDAQRPSLAPARSERLYSARRKSGSEARLREGLKRNLTELSRDLLSAMRLTLRRRPDTEH